MPGASSRGVEFGDHARSCACVGRGRPAIWDTSVSEAHERSFISSLASSVPIALDKQLFCEYSGRCSALSQQAVYRESKACLSKRTHSDCILQGNRHKLSSGHWTGVGNSTMLHCKRDGTLTAWWESVSTTTIKRTNCLTLKRSGKSIGISTPRCYRTCYAKQTRHIRRSLLDVNMALLLAIRAIKAGTNLTVSPIRKVGTASRMVVVSASQK